MLYSFLLSAISVYLSTLSMRKPVILLVVLFALFWSAYNKNVCPASTVIDALGLYDRALWIEHVADNGNAFRCYDDAGNLVFELETDQLRSNCQNFELKVLVDNKDPNQNKVTTLDDSKIYIDTVSGIDMETFVTLSPSDFEDLECLKAPTSTGTAFMCEMTFIYWDLHDLQDYLFLDAMIIVQMGDGDNNYTTPQIAVLPRNDTMCNCTLVYDVPIVHKLYSDPDLTLEIKEGDELLVGATIYIHSYLEEAAHRNIYRLDLNSFLIQYGIVPVEDLEYGQAVWTKTLTITDHPLEGMLMEVVLPTVDYEFKVDIIVELKDITRRGLEDEDEETKGVLVEIGPFEFKIDNTEELAWWEWVLIIGFSVLAVVAAVFGVKKCRTHKKLCWKPVQTNNSQVNTPISEPMKIKDLDVQITN